MYDKSSRFDSPPAIHVTGAGRAAVAPDLARVVFSVDTEGRDLARVQGENSARMAAVLARLKELGIADRDLRTIGYSIEPRYDPKLQRHDGYRLSSGVRATIREIAVVGGALAAGVAAGATGVSQIGFAPSDPDAALRQAREEAVRHAREKAEHYAALTGVELGPAILIVEGDTRPGYGRPQFVALSARAAGPDAPPPIEAGEQEVAVTVAVAYRID